MNCLFTAFCDKKNENTYNTPCITSLRCCHDIVAIFLVNAMHQEAPLVKILLDHMFLEEFAVVGFIWLIISPRFAIVRPRIVDHVCDVMATAGDQKTRSVIT